MKISRGLSHVFCDDKPEVIVLKFLVFVEKNQFLLMIENRIRIHGARKTDAGADDKPGYFCIWP